MGIFDLLKPKWKHSDPDVREKAVEQIKDQNVLFEIAQTDPAYAICEKAVRRINDQKLLSAIVEKNPDYSIKLIATKLIIDQSILGKLAVENCASEIGKAAAVRLKDHSILANIAKHPDENCREAVFCNLQEKTIQEILHNTLDQDLLAAIALYSHNPITSQKALKKITDQDLLAALMKRKKEQKIIKKAQKSSSADKQKKPGEGCPFNKNGLCVPPIGGMQSAVSCSLQAGVYHSNCTVYPIHCAKKQRGY